MPSIWIGPKTWSAATGLLGGAKHLDFHTKRLLQKHGSPFARGCFLPGQMFARKQFGDAGTENGHAPEPCNQKPMANGLQLPWAAWSHVLLRGGLCACPTASSAVWGPLDVAWLALALWFPARGRSVMWANQGSERWRTTTATPSKGPWTPSCLGRKKLQQRLKCASWCQCNFIRIQKSNSKQNPQRQLLLPSNGFGPGRPLGDHRHGSAHLRRPVHPRVAVDHHIAALQRGSTARSAAPT